MSKLFDTLEKIQNNDTYTPPAASDFQQPPKSKGKKYIIVPVVLAACAVIFFFVLQRSESFKVFRKSASQSSGISTVQVPQSSTMHANTAAQKMSPQGDTVASHINTDGSDSLQQMNMLNNQGVKLISKSEYWAGIYYLNKAHTLSPRSIEPLINMGVALMELGLTVPANRFFHKALAIDPDNKKLRDNLILAAQARKLDDSLLALVSGETIFR